VDEYYILNGVHRAVAARENGLQVILAFLFVEGQVPQLLAVPLDRLHSPKSTISRSDPRHSYLALEKAMSTPAGRSIIPEIEIEFLGSSGQTGSVPLAQVVLRA
jgi:hypothetical protein